MFSSRPIVLIAVAGASAWVYRRAFVDDLQGDLESWTGFLLLWLPASILLGLGAAYVWPRVVSWWESRRRAR